MVTNQDYIEFLNEAEINSEAKHPVTYVSWYGAVAYCNWLSKKEDLEVAYDLSNCESKHYRTG